MPQQAWDYIYKKSSKALINTIDVQSKLEEGTTFTLTFPEQNDFVISQACDKNVTCFYYLFAQSKENNRILL